MLQKISTLLKEPFLYVLLFLLVLNILQPIFANSGSNYDTQVIAGPEIPDTQPDTARMTYQEFKKRQQEHTFLEKHREAVNLGTGGTGITTVFIGFEKFSECFNCNTYQQLTAPGALQEDTPYNRNKP